MHVHLEAQKSSIPKFKFGFSLDHGSQFLLDVDYDYKVDVFNVYLYKKIIAKKSWGLDLFLNPQFGVNSYREEYQSKLWTVGQEVGLNGGLLLTKSIIKNKLSIYCMLSAGPRFISGAPSRQIGGFIFSDNATSGLIFHLDTECSVFLGGGIRHLSNANLKKPNGGINTSTIQLGLMLMVH